MASSSGPPKDQQRESTSACAATSTDASTAAAAQGGAVASHPPPHSPSESITQEWAHVQPGGGGRGTDGSSSAAVAVDRKGKKQIVAFDGREQARRKEKSDSPIKKLLRTSILALQGHAKKKLSDRQGKQPDCPNQNSRASMPKSPPHVGHKKIPMREAMYHYFGNIDNAIQQREVAVYLMDLDANYSEFRPVRRDGENFYRSFMFSYLEQVVDRVDTREEDRLLDAVSKVASRAEHLQWASEFSRRCEALEMLIEKIKGWKHMLEHPTSTFSYNRGEFLLELFSDYDTMDDIFAVLRLVAAIWMCTHRGLYGRRAIPFGDSHSLEDWCSTQVTPPGVHADLVTMSSLSRALRVAVRVEDTLDGRRKDLFAGELHSAIRGSKPHAGRIEDIYCTARNTPRVNLVRIYPHSDILYPLPPGATSAGLNPLQPERQLQGGGSQQHPDPAAGTSSRRAAQEEQDRAESSSQGAARARARWFHCCIGGSKKQQS